MSSGPDYELLMKRTVVGILTSSQLENVSLCVPYDYNWQGLNERCIGLDVSSRPELASPVEELYQTPDAIRSQEGFRFKERDDIFLRRAEDVFLKLLLN